MKINDYGSLKIEEHTLSSAMKGFFETFKFRDTQEVDTFFNFNIDFDLSVSICSLHRTIVSFNQLCL